jgi:hypothetical protein
VEEKIKVNDENGGQCPDDPWTFLKERDASQTIRGQIQVMSDNTRAPQATTVLPVIKTCIYKGIGMRI